MPPRTLVTALLLGLTATASSLAQVQWTSLSPTPRPGKRSIHAIAWMEKRAILLGGETRTPTHYLNDTWSWDGSRWTPRPASSPSPRGGHAMAYDPPRKRLVLFSGWNGGRYVQDTWEFDGTTWHQMTVATQPPPRDWAQMAFDPIAKKVVLFGGHDWHRSATGHAFDDTWTWDGKAWKALPQTTEPSWRFGNALVHDKAIS